MIKSFLGKLLPHRQVPRSDGFIDVKELIASVDLQTHLERADAYFRDMSINSDEFRKPFMGSEAVRLVPALGAVLSHLEFYKGIRILDFGSGTGWLSQSLALMGAKVFSVDASERALRLAKQYTLSKYPELEGCIEYVVFNGTKIAVQDGSIDRIVCMDSFHHVPNQATVLAEFSRVLGKDGRVVFAEPGERHSASAESQQAMRQFGVIENDIVLADIWPIAQSAGFESMKVAAHATAPLLTLAEFESLRTPSSSGGTMRRLYDEVYFPLNSGGRLFVLGKTETSRDSRFREGLSCKLSATVHHEGPMLRINLVARNTGSNAWRESGGEPGCVNAGLILRRRDGTWDYEFQRDEFLRSRLLPGEEISFSVRVLSDAIGPHELYADLVAEHVIWFGQNNQSPIRLL
jgi:2-polyprenyl-3-methyl-5-hydroxy-6-metoxy-1,4-benzoquinol methylase